MPPKPAFRPALALVAITWLLGGCALASFFTDEVAFTPVEMTEKLARRFPIERNIADLLKVKLTRPRVSFLEADSAVAPRRLAVGVDLDVKLPLTSRTLFGQMTLSGVPRYDITTRAIFLQDAKLDRVRVDNMPDALSAALVKAASRIAKEFFEETPIYSFDSNDFKRLGKTVILERIDLRENQMVLVLK